MASPPDPITQNVETIAALRARAEEELTAHQRRIEWVTTAVGRPGSIYIALLVVASWITLNTWGRWAGVRAPDPPPFQWLQGALGLAALLVAIMVLTTQNRQSRHAEQRAQLDLQVNLLAEQKVAKLIALVEELRRDMPSVPDRVDPVAEGMIEPLDPEVVLTVLEDTFEQPSQHDAPPQAKRGGGARR